MSYHKKYDNDCDDCCSLRRKIIFIPGPTGPSGTLENFTSSVSNVCSITYTVLNPIPDITNNGIVLYTKGTGPLIRNIPTPGLAEGGNCRGDYSLDLQSTRTLDTQVASGINSVLSGGKDNTASGNNSTVSGGLTNEASEDYSTVSGGRENSASSNRSTVGGGFNNRASSSSSTVSGGLENSASGISSTVSGGRKNSASGSSSTVGGGSTNEASGSSSTVSGGSTNEASGSSSTIGGGFNNTASGDGSIIPGGYINTASGVRSTVGGGEENIASDISSTVSGGFTNKASSNSSTVGGGTINTASGNYSTVGGGFDNESSGKYSTIPGGLGNKTTYEYSTSIGKYNKPGIAPDNAERVFMIGWGSGRKMLNRSNLFSVTENGNVYCKGALFINNPNPFAEYKESQTGEEYKIGTYVLEIDGKISETERKYASGVVVEPSTVALICNSAEEHWQGKYMKENGIYIYEEIEKEEIENETEEKEITKIVEKYDEDADCFIRKRVTEMVKVNIMKRVKIIDENGVEVGERVIPKTKKVIRKEKIIKVNPEYDNTKEYIPRSQRKEWHLIKPNMGNW